MNIGLIKNLIVIAVILGALFVAYNTFFKEDPGSTTLVVVDGEVPGEAPEAAVQFLKTLEDLKKIKLDVAFFGEEAYRKLEDWSVPVVSESRGRTNPFAPL